MSDSTESLAMKAGAESPVPSTSLDSNPDEDQSQQAKLIGESLIEFYNYILFL